jgi:hypothetical protein
MIGLLANNELERTWKEMYGKYSDVILRHLLGRNGETKESHDSRSPSPDFKPGPSGYASEVVNFPDIDVG